MKKHCMVSRRTMNQRPLRSLHALATWTTRKNGDVASKTWWSIGETRSMRFHRRLRTVRNSSFFSQIVYILYCIFIYHSLTFFLYNYSINICCHATLIPLSYFWPCTSAVISYHLQLSWLSLCASCFAKSIPKDRFERHSRPIEKWTGKCRLYADYLPKLKQQLDWLSPENRTTHLFFGLLFSRNNGKPPERLMTADFTGHFIILKKLIA